MSENKLAPIDAFRGSMTQMRDQFRAALPPQIDVDRFIRVAVTAIQNSPKLLETDRKTLYSACMRAAQSGLLPDGVESAIVKYGDTAVFMPMTQGILKQVRNSGELKAITAQVVCKNDKFRYWIDSDGEHLEHEPNWFSDRGERVGVYAIATTKDGGIYIEPLSAKQVMDVKNVSRSKNDGPWSGPFDEEMWRKTAIRRLSKRLPKSTDIDGLIKSDDELFMPPPAQAQPDVPPVDKSESPKEENKRPSKTAKLVQAAVSQQTESAPEPAFDQTQADRQTEPVKPPVKNYAPGAGGPAEGSPI